MVKIYIADDSYEVRERLMELIVGLQLSSLEIRAEQAQAETSAIQEFQPDAAILDIRMPGGIQILESIKALQAPPLLIILTAFPSNQYQKKCLQAGADYFFDKTSEFEKISEVIMRLSVKTENSETKK